MTSLRQRSTWSFDRSRCFPRQALDAGARLEYVGIDRRAAGVTGQTTHETAADLVQRLYRNRYRCLVVRVAGREVGGIEPAVQHDLEPNGPSHSHRVWWAEGIQSAGGG